jgi:hypothetical protein
VTAEVLHAFRRERHRGRSANAVHSFAVELKPGTRLRSVTDSTEVIIVRAPGEPLDVRCGGQPMVPIGPDTTETEVTTVEAGFDGGTQVGKRYTAEGSGVELLCTKAGTGSLSLGTDLLVVQGAKPLPSSD